MKAVELFAGAGGLGIGISAAGFTPARIVEWDRWCCDTINENRKARVSSVKSWPEPTLGDVRDVDFSSLEGKIDLVSGGPPCQPFSLGGKHQGHNDNRDMWPQAVRVLRETKPKAFLFENVKGLSRSSFATYLSYIELQLEYPEIVSLDDEGWQCHLARLEKHHTQSKDGQRSETLHYKVVKQVLNAADFGVPQRRERIVFVGFRADLGIAWSFPEKSHSVDALLWDQCRSQSYWDRHRVARAYRSVDVRNHNRAMSLGARPQPKAWRTVRDAIHDLPEPGATASTQYLNHRLQLGAKSYAGHTGSPLDEPAKTLKAGVHGVPGGENMLLRPDGTVRYFSVRESARLQTFPDNYAFHGSWTETMRQLGNAVPVALAAVIARDIRKHLKNG